MDELKKLLENAGVTAISPGSQLIERDEDVIKPVVDAIVYAYNEMYYNDTDQGVNDIERLEAVNDIADAARHRAGDKVIGNQMVGGDEDNGRT